MYPTVNRECNVCRAINLGPDGKNKERDFFVSYCVLLIFVGKTISYYYTVVRCKINDNNIRDIIKLSSIFRVVCITPVGIVKDIVQVCMLYYRIDARPGIEHHRAQHFTTHGHRPPSSRDHNEFTIDLFKADF